MIHARDPESGCSLQMAIAPRCDGHGELMMAHNGTVIVRLLTGAMLQLAHVALENRDAAVFGELMFPTQPQAQEAAA